MDITLEYVNSNCHFLYDIITGRAKEVDRNKIRLSRFTASERIESRLIGESVEEQLKKAIKVVKLDTVKHAIFGTEATYPSQSSPRVDYYYPGILSILKTKTISVEGLISCCPVMKFAEGCKLRIEEVYSDGWSYWTVASVHRIDFDNLPSSR